MKILAVIDMQNDFISGSLGTKEAQEILPRVMAKITERRKQGYTVLFTRDTHTEDYLDTREGKRLPVPHCVVDTQGWQIADGLAAVDDKIIDKPTFGSMELAWEISDMQPEEVEFVGLCTDICVISNVMILKAQLPELDITVDAACCAGVTPESHTTALNAMKMCQVDIINE